MFNLPELQNYNSPLADCYMQKSIPIASGDEIFALLVHILTVFAVTAQT